MLSYKNNYHPQRSWGKVMFLQASVILLTGGEGGYSPPEQTPPPGADTPPGSSRHPLRSKPPQSRHPPPGAADTPLGADTPRSRHLPRACCQIRSTRERYASYWNAILFSMFLKANFRHIFERYSIRSISTVFSLYFLSENISQSTHHTYVC